MRRQPQIDVRIRRVKAAGNAQHVNVRGPAAFAFEGQDHAEAATQPLGLAAAVELAPIAGTPGKRAYEIFLDCFHKGALVRPAGDVLVIAPPYIVEKSHIDTLVNTLADSIKAHA